MSGEAGAMIEGANYSVFVGSGLSVSIAISPGGDGSEIGEYFDAAARPFRSWLERARPALDALFADSGLPLAPLAGPLEQVDGAIIETPDTSAGHFRQYHRGGPLLLFVDGRGRLDDFQSLRLRIAVTTRVRRSDLDALIDRVASILKAAKS